MPWQPWEKFKDVPMWTPEAHRLSGSNGVYEIADENYSILYTGYAGSRARYGLRGKLKDHFSDEEPNPEIKGKGRYFRYEVTSSYISRWYEICGRHSQRGTIPPANAHARDLPRTMPFFGTQT